MPGRKANLKIFNAEQVMPHQKDYSDSFYVFSLLGCNLRLGKIYGITHKNDSLKISLRIA